VMKDGDDIGSVDSFDLSDEEQVKKQLDEF
jgi:hypothetical protein